MRRSSARILGLLLSLALTCVALGQGKLTSVTTEKKVGGLVVHIKGENLRQPKLSDANGVTVFIAEFEAALVGNEQAHKVTSSGVDNINVVQIRNNPATTRVILRGSTGISPKVAKTAHGWDILVGSATACLSTETDTARAGIAADEKFPEKVPPLGPAARILAGQLAPQVSAVGNAPAAKAAVVSLNFVDADVVQVLRALATQANMNIVIAPEITNGNGGPAFAGTGEMATQPGMMGTATGRRITVTLARVSVEEALDFVTSLSGLRYAKVGTTYVVTTKESYGEIIKTLADRAGGLNEIKVVPIMSGQGSQIKEALARWFGPTVLEVMLPSDVAAGSSTALADLPATVGKNGVSNYLILIGSRKWVDQAEDLAKTLDTSLAKMAGIDTGSAESFAPMSATYEVRNAKATDLADALRMIVKDDGSGGGASIISSGADSPGQAVYLHGRRGEVQRLMTILTELDAVPVGNQQVYQVYDVRYSDPRALRDHLKEAFPRMNIAVGPPSVLGRSYKEPKDGGSGDGGMMGGMMGGGMMGAAQGGGAGSGQGRGANTSAEPVFSQYEADAVPMKLILSGASLDVENALMLLAQLDVPVPQISIEARVIEASKEDLLRFGIDWDMFTQGAVRFIRLNNSQPPAPDGGPFNEAGIHIGGRGWGGDVTASIDKMITQNNLIARPNVVANDGREAVVFVGDVVRYVKNIQSGQQGTSIEVGEEEVGVKLNVLPRVNVDNTISMDVQPTVSFIRAFVPTGEGASVPITSVRTARSSIRVRDGETFAIGGLINEEDRKSVSGIPILMDLPIIGQLFRRTTTSKVRTEVIIFITVRVVDSSPDGEAVIKPAGNDK